MKTRFYTALLLYCFAFSAQAAAPEGCNSCPPPPCNSGPAVERGQGECRPEPPPQAYADCKGKKAGDSVQHVTPRGEKIEATCTASSKGLFARPPHPPR